MFRKAVIISGFFLITLLHCAHLENARKAYSEQNYRETIALCLTAIAADSTDAEAYLLLGKSQMALNDLRKAETSLETALELSPGSSRIRQALSELYMRRADRYHADNDMPRAILQLQKAEKLDPDNPSLILRIADLCFNEGRLDMAKDRYTRLIALKTGTDHAARQLQKIEEKTREADRLTREAVTAIQNDHLVTARTRLMRALAVKSDHQTARYHLLLVEGRLLYQKGSEDALWEALELYGKAMIINPDAAEPHFRMAEAYEKKKEYEFVNAIDEYRLALDKDPDGPFADRCRQRIQALTAKKNRLDKFWNEGR